MKRNITVTTNYEYSDNIPTELDIDGFTATIRQHIDYFTAANQSNEVVIIADITLYADKELTFNFCVDISFDRDGAVDELTVDYDTQYDLVRYNGLNESGQYVVIEGGYINSRVTCVNIALMLEKLYESASLTSHATTNYK